MSEHLKGRCGTCARFVRVVETIDQNGEVRRHGECLLGVWPSPLFETNTCSQYVLKGTFQSTVRKPVRTGSPRRSSAFGSPSRSGEAVTRGPITIPEELLDMDADEFRAVLREVIRDEL